MKWQWEQGIPQSCSLLPTTSSSPEQKSRPDCALTSCHAALPAPGCCGQLSDTAPGSQTSHSDPHCHHVVITTSQPGPDSSA